MIRIGITGGIASGKSTVCAMFARFCIPVFDADAAVRQLYTTPKVIRWFTLRLPDVVKGHVVHRPTLAHHIMKTPEWLGEIEAMIHPLVCQEEANFWRTQKGFGYEMTLSDIPLLVESGTESRYDSILLVTAPLWLRKQRAMRRDGMTEATFDMLCAKQLPDDVKRRAVAGCITTGAGYADTARQVAQWYNTLVLLNKKWALLN